MSFVHPTSIIDAGAQIGKNACIWHFCHISAETVIGSDVTIGQNVFVANGASIDDGCKIQNNVSIYSGVHLSKNVFCGPSVVFTNVINPRANIDRKTEFKKTLIGEGATLGANSTLVCGITLGKFSFVGAGAVVTKNFSDYALVVGVPAKQVGWVSESGYRLDLPISGKKNATCEDSGECYSLEEGVLKKFKK